MTEQPELPKRRHRIEDSRKDKLQFSGNMLEYTTKLEFLLSETNYKLRRIQSRFQKIVDFAQDLTAAGYAVPLPSAETLKRYDLKIDVSALWEDAKRETLEEPNESLS